MRLTSQIVETEYGTYEVHKYVKEKCKSDCIECDDRCEFGYQTAEMLVI